MGPDLTRDLLCVHRRRPRRCERGRYHTLGYLGQTLLCLLHLASLFNGRSGKGCPTCSATGEIHSVQGYLYAHRQLPYT